MGFLSGTYVRMLHMDADIEIRKEIEGKNISYIHFDRRIKLTNHLWCCITNKKWVLRHGFYPFIHFKRPKYHKSWSTDSSGKRIWKDDGPQYRDILYSAHKDAWIYRYYGALFNRQYNQYLGNKGIDDCSIAYRTNKKGKSNISFAEEALAFIKFHKPCYVIIGDFTHFFDFLDHTYLLNQIRSILDSQYIPDDIYYVLNSLLHYSYVDYEAITSYKRMTHQQLCQCQTVLTDQEFRILSRKKQRESKDDQFIIKINREHFGIPQGSPMSGVLANIYMIQFDEKIFELVRSYHGIYRRYSDDFIIAIPEKYITEEQYQQMIHQLQGIFNQRNTNTGKYLVKLSPEKTKKYRVSANLIIYNEQKEHGIISFLGFSYDGKRVYIKDSSVRRYYSHAYSKADHVVKQNVQLSQLKKNKRRTTNLYTLYSISGLYRNSSKSKRGSNFPVYSQRAHFIFQKNLKSENQTGLVAQRHMRQLRKRLNSPK